jgi:tRNA U34 2-thiouridine synthase MnmA/TrmU
MHNVDISKGIQVGGFRFSVDTSESSRKHLDADRDLGQCDFDNHTIQINNKIDSIHQSKVFIHEVIEAVNQIYCDGEIPHPNIQRLSYGLHQVLEDLGVRFGK